MQGTRRRHVTGMSTGHGSPNSVCTITRLCVAVCRKYLGLMTDPTVSTCPTVPAYADFASQRCVIT